MAKITLYNDGAVARLHNKKIAFKEADGKVMINFRFADKDANIPACQHICYRGKVRETFIQMSKDAMETLVMAYLEQQRQKSFGSFKK